MHVFTRYYGARAILFLLSLNVTAAYTDDFAINKVADPIYGLPLAQPRQVGMSAERLARIAPAMQRSIDAAEAPGLLTVIARHGKVVHLEAQGYSDVERKKPLTPDTIFRLYSMTKPVTGVAVMMLYEEGGFFLDDPIAKYIPEFANMRVYNESGELVPAKPITIEHLLTYTAGLMFGSVPVHPIQHQMHNAGLNDVLARLDGPPLSQYIPKLARSVPLLAQPGTAWEYGEETNVLARLVEVVAGQTFSEFLRERIFQPLGMVDTAFYVPADKVDRFGPLYVLDAQGNMTLTQGYGGDFSKKPVLESGSAGLVGTASDYLRFAQMLLNGGELDGVRLLSPTTVRLMTTNHLGPELGDTPLASLPITLTMRRGLGFGFCGLVVTDATYNGAGSKGEYSWGGWANTNFWIDPEQDLVALVFTQVIDGSRVGTRERMHQLTYQAIVGK